MDGVNCAIDAVGYQAISGEDGELEDPMQTIKWISKLINPTGYVGIIGVYFGNDPGGVDENAKKGEYTVLVGALWEKGVTIGQGQAPVKRYNEYLRDMIIAGRARPSFIVSHRFPLSQASEAYAKSDRRGTAERYRLHQDRAHARPGPQGGSTARPYRLFRVELISDGTYRHWAGKFGTPLDGA